MIGVQQTTGALAPSLVRTLVPFLAGLVGTWLVDEFAVELDSNVVVALLTAAIGYLYYVLARFAEVFVSDKWGYVLGIRKPPAYTTVPGAVLAVVDEPVSSVPPGEPTSGVPPAEH